ncbi:MAG: hypothetical protein HUK22_04800, partial [Thermoguttaceae bacterium]|nr:hypothetical protein [Thermoguttaceae bacterium]
MQYATEKAFRIRGALWGLTFVPPVLVAIFIANVGFLIFEYYDVAYLYSFVFHFSFVLTFVWIFNTIQPPINRTAFFVVGVLVAYPIFGFFVLFASALATLMEATRRLNLRRAALFALVILVIPGVFAPIYLASAPNSTYLFVAGFPRESPIYTEYSLAPIYAVLVFYALAAVYSALIAARAKSQSSAQDVPNAIGKASAVFSALTIVAALGAAVYFSYSGQNYFALLKVARSLDREDWKTLLAEEAKVGHPVNPLISARLLALDRTRQLADAAFLRPLDPSRTPILEQISTSCMCGDRILYEHGAVNLAMRSAMNNFVSKRERSTWALKTLALCAITVDNRNLAERYLFRLQGTLFHRVQAVEFATFVKQTSAESPRPGYNLATLHNDAATKTVERLAPQFAAVRNRIPTVDKYAPPQCVDNMIYFQTQSDEISRVPLPERENLLALLLVMRDLPTFYNYFDGYLAEKARG